MTERLDFVQVGFANHPEWLEVKSVADEIVAYLEKPRIRERIRTVDVPGASSSAIQSVILERAESLGFRNEAKGLFKSYPNNGLRPDYFRKVGDSGILLEVERGKTNINNMDFLDFWKCHICEHAHYLFLMVPLNLVQNSSGRSSKPFETTVKHMSSFFSPSNYTNVRGLVLIGY